MEGQAMKAAVRCGLVCLLLLPACSDDDNGGNSSVDGGNNTGDGPPVYEAGTKCKPYQSDGVTCAGGGTCAKGQTCVNDGASAAPVCRLKCDTKGSNQCGDDKCGRTCVGLVDSTGKTLDYGACVRGWITEGEQCGSGAMCDLQKKLRCIGSGASFCRKECTDAKDCKGYKVSCLGVTGQTWKVCGPGNTSSGAKEGKDCSDKATYCAAGLLCDPTSKKCLKYCSTLKGSTATCGACSGKSCTKVVDSSAGVTLGYACVAGKVYDAGVPDCSVPEAGVKEGGVKEGGVKEGGAKDAAQKG